MGFCSIRSSNAEVLLLARAVENPGDADNPSVLLSPGDASIFVQCDKLAASSRYGRYSARKTVKNGSK